MKLSRIISSLFLAGVAFLPTVDAQQVSYVQISTKNGVLEGVVSGDGKVRTFKGIPYAAAPVGALRWKAPEPPPSWKGVRKATEYAPRAMQGRIFDDMIFKDSGPSEDCLYLNLWMPADLPAGTKLPVMVWIHGGGFVAGSSSEPRQDAGNLSKKGVLVVSMNYRMGVFGFLAHPELTRESPHGASGNYGLLDLVAALQWVKENIATFGGNPDNVTLFGESAGSSAVSALMASPLAQGLFHRAIGESGAFFSKTRPLKSRAETEQIGLKFGQNAFGTSSIAELRSKSADELLELSLKQPRSDFRPNLDGYFLPESCETIFSAGQQAHVPLLAGWNRDENSYRSFFGKEEPTVENYVRLAKARFGKDAEMFLNVYAASSDQEAKRAAQDFAGDQSTGYSTWKWLELHRQTGASPVYRFRFDQTLPLPPHAPTGTEPTAPHASEIEFVFRVLASRELPWRAEDKEVSETMASYWTNFAKHGDPNGEGLPPWPAYTAENDQAVMHLKVPAEAAPDNHRARYQFLDQIDLAP